MKKKRIGIKKITKPKRTKKAFTKTITPNHLKKKKEKKKESVQNMQHTKYQTHNHYRKKILFELTAFYSNHTF